MRATVLIIDDIIENIEMLFIQLEDRYNIIVAENEQKALNIVLNLIPDIILFNTDSCNINIYKVCQQLKTYEELKDIPIVFIIQRYEVENVNKGVELDITDYIIKPINSAVLKCRIRNLIDYSKTARRLKDRNAYLESEIHNIQDLSILSMASFAETRDNATGDHIMRTKLYVQELANELRRGSKYREYLTNENVNLIVKSAPLHDIGKVGIPDAILLKPGSLTCEEFDIMKTHTTLGLSAILSVEKIMENSDAFLKFAKEIIYSHHEHWNGKGYPQGLKGEEIPLSARLMSVADVYDALISKRIYKKAYHHDEAVNIIREGSGKHFDPDIVEVFLNLEKKFKKISDRYRNN